MNIDISLTKEWSMGKHYGLMLKGQMVLNPYYMWEDKTSVEWNPKNPGKQSVNLNLAFGVYFK